MRCFNPMILAQRVAICVMIAMVSLPVDAQEAPPAEQGVLIICHPPVLTQSAQQWALYRTSQGWATRLLPFAAGEATTTTAAKRLDASITRLAVEARDNQPERHIAVLLLGDSPAVGESCRSLLPTFRFKQTDPVLIDPNETHYASDHPYQCFDSDSDTPDVSLGRIPVRTNSQALAVLDKIKRYEYCAATEPWPVHVEYVVGEGHFGKLDRLLEALFMTMVQQLVPDRCTINVSYAKPDAIYCPPPGRLTQTVLEQLATPAMLFNYVGHGHERGLDSLSWQSHRYRMLNVDDVAKLRGNKPAAPLALLNCCSAGWFDLPANDVSLAEALLLHPAGPPAIFAGSRPTHPYANAVVQQAITESLLAGHISTVGALDLASATPALRSSGSRQLDLIAGPIAIGMQWASTLSQLRTMHTRMYNLLGDPAMILPTALPRLESLAIGNGHLRGATSLASEGDVVITIESSQVRPANADALLDVHGRNDPDLPAKAARNHRLANQRLISTYRIPLEDGRFSIPLSMRQLPANAAIIRVVILASDNPRSRSAPIATDALPITMWTRLRR